MPSPKTFRCALTLRITVDDDTVRSSMLGAQLSDGIGGPIIEDDEETFEFQQQQLSSMATMSSRALMQTFMANRVYMPLAGPLRQQLLKILPGAEIQIELEDVEPVED
jgi:hypothetical protein